MKKLNLNLLVLLILTIPNLVKAQSYVGHSVDNYSGVHGLISNPSNVVDSRVKTDVNLFSASVFGGSDYFGINVGDVIKSDGGFDFEADAEKFPSNANNFFLNADILGPSFMFNLTPKSSIGMVSRVRAFFNINNISGELYENLADNFDTDEDFIFDSQNLTGTIHAWAEVGLVYGRVFMDKEQNFLKGGVTLKYLQGAGGVFINSPSFTGNYNANDETLTTTGSLQYGISQDFDNDDIEFNNLTSGFGADVGFTYEFRPSVDLDSVSRKDNKYKLKIGLSITDIGSIDYKESVVTTYDLNATADASDYDEDTEDFLDNNYTSTEETIAQKINLPTAFHFLADYNINNKLYVSLQTNLSLVKKNTASGNNIINSVTIAPRLETKWFSIYSPVSFRQYGDFAWGGGIRLGPLMVGSGSILSNLLSDTTKTTDVYLGLKIPIYQ
ncbi:DUF5723 family protein [Algibacter sp. AS12]|uniref:DUF5723 family protein n=1 Tax=Algibacter sp. AS12 TaxID=3135773 RepID=UPI00398AC6A8